MKPKMDGDTIGAIADLRHSEIHPVWRQLIIGSGIAIIVASLLYYLGIFG